MSINELKNLKEIVDCLVNQSQSSIIKNNFINNFYRHTIDGKLYGSFKLFGAKSFRLTSNNPNLLNLPSTGTIYAKPVKQCFEAEKGKIFLVVDLNALEDRTLANLSGDENKCAIFNQKIDGHCLNSYYYFRDEIEAILPREKDEPLYDYIRRYHQEVENGNKALKDIRQRSKQPTFGMNYGAFPKKLLVYIKTCIEDCTRIFNMYHYELYPGVTKMREEYVLPTAKNNGRIHLGLGCYLNSSNPEKEIRTLNNAVSQFWSILSLLTIHKFNQHLEYHKLNENIKVISSIYDSIYIYMDDNPELIKWTNDLIIPLLTKDFLVNQLVHNEAESEIGYNWYDTKKIPNNASLEDIIKIRGELNGI